MRGVYYILLRREGMPQQLSQLHQLFIVLALQPNDHRAMGLNRLLLSLFLWEPDATKQFLCVCVSLLEPLVMEYLEERDPVDWVTYKHAFH
jgi:hypothetical protein